MTDTRCNDPCLWPEEGAGDQVDPFLVLDDGRSSSPAQKFPRIAAARDAAVGEAVADLLAELRRTDGKEPAWKIPFRLARVLKPFPVESPVEFEDIAIKFFKDLGLDADDCWTRFILCWEIVRVPAGEDSWDSAVKAAKDRPLSISPNPGKQLAPLASVPAYLDAARPGEPFVFPLARIMKSFELKKMAASRAVEVLASLRIIKVVNPQWSYTNGIARTFRFIGTVGGPAV